MGHEDWRKIRKSWVSMQIFGKLGKSMHDGAAQDYTFAKNRERKFAIYTVWRGRKDWDLGKWRFG